MTVFLIWILMRLGVLEQDHFSDFGLGCFETDTTVLKMGFCVIESQQDV